MPEYLSPGVFMEEIEMGGKPIEGVSTSTAGFLGETERGPIAPRLVTTFAQYERIYGGFLWTVGASSDAEKTAATNAKAVADRTLRDKAAARKAAKTAADAAPPAEKAAADEALRRAIAEEAAADEAARQAVAVVTSMAEGPKSSNSYLPYSVEGFFANGGKRCYVGRIAGNGSRAAALSPLVAVGPGTWGNRIAVAVRKVSIAKKDEGTDKVFRLLVYYWDRDIPKGRIDPQDVETKPREDDPNREELEKKAKDEWISPKKVEEFDNLSWDPASPDYYERQLHGRSQFIEVTDEGGIAEVLKGRKATEPSSLIQFLGGGQDGAAPTLKEYKGDEDTPSGLTAFVERDDISIVCVPDASEVVGLNDAVVSHCELMRDRIAVLHAAEDAGSIADLFPNSKVSPTSAGGAINSKYAAFYYPWIKVVDPVTNLPKLVPPSGHVAGIYARSDTERGVHKAPANEPVRGVIDLQFNVNKGDQDILNPRGVNCIRAFPGRGILLWGARTTSSDPLWKYVNVRRLFLFLEKSIERSTQWLVFEPNNERLWARVRQSVSDFLTQVWKDGALMGLTPEQAFFVRCDETTMTPNEIETGRLIVIVGVAPARPAEFVIFRLAQWRSGSSITE